MADRGGFEPPVRI